MPGELSVKAALRRNVRRDLLVAIQAQARLSLAVAAVVAQRALLLVFGMGVGELAGHEESLRVHGITSRGPQAQQQNEHQKCSTLTLPHEACGPPALIDVDRDHVDYSGNQHQENQRQVQRVPQREQPLVGFEPCDAPGRGQAAVDVGKGRAPQALALRGDSRRTRGSLAQAPAHIGVQLQARHH